MSKVVMFVDFTYEYSGHAENAMGNLNAWLNEPYANGKGKKIINIESIINQSNVKDRRFRVWHIKD
jgi:hypothetical protein